MKITIGQINFISKKEATAYVRSLIEKTGYCNSLKIQPTTYNFLMELFQNHPNPNKVEGTIDIKIGKDPIYNKGYCLYLMKEDNTEDTISWNACISTNSINIYSVLRNAISDQIMEFRKKSLQESTICGICSKDTQGNCHIDHINFFSYLVKDFIKDWPLEIPSTFVKTQHQWDFHTDDEGFKIAFQEYHRAFAKLRITCPKCNLERVLS
jgi:hypothetical protein